MYKKQLGRRNLTDEQRTVLIGKMYEARRHSVGNHAERGEDGKYLSYQNGNLGKQGKTAEQIAKEIGVGYGTVMRARDYSNGIDTLQAVSPEAAEKVLNGGSGATLSLLFVNVCDMINYVQEYS